MTTKDKTNDETDARKGTTYYDDLVNSTNVKEKLGEITENLIKNARDFTQGERNEIVTKLTDAYIELTGIKPDTKTLYLLGNFILSDDFHVKDPHKRSRPYSFTSPHQEQRERRQKRTIAVGYWNIANGITTGHKKSWYRDENDTISDSKQPIIRYNM